MADHHIPLKIEGDRVVGIKARPERTLHTPGPWQACKEGDCQCGMIWDVTGNCLVAVAQGETEHLKLDQSGPDCTPPDDAQKANARLIAAAPGLLVAARMALDCAQSLNPEMTAAYAALNAAIAKVEGCPNA